MNGLIKKALLLLALVIGIGYWYWYRTPKHSQGESAPDFVGYLPDGDSIRLSDFRGKMVLLDFWGSWCGPCRQANPKLVALHQKFASSGKFEIISVGLETSKKAWLNAITNDRLSWKYHISDLRNFDDHVALLYGVRVIPTTILIGTDGTIKGVKLSEGEMERIISENI